MNWFLLIIAGFFEVGFTTCLSKAKEAEGNNLIFWLICFLFCLVASMFLIYKVTQTFSMGTAYAVWTGIGATGTVLVGIFLFNESASFWRLFFIFTLIASIVGLKFVDKN